MYFKTVSQMQMDLEECTLDAFYPSPVAHEEEEEDDDLGDLGKFEEEYIGTSTSLVSESVIRQCMEIPSGKEVAIRYTGNPRKLSEELERLKAGISVKWCLDNTVRVKVREKECVNMRQLQEALRKHPYPRHLKTGRNKYVYVKSAKEVESVLEGYKTCGARTIHIYLGSDKRMESELESLLCFSDAFVPGKKEGYTSHINGDTFVMYIYRD